MPGHVIVAGHGHIFATQWKDRQHASRCNVHIGRSGYRSAVILWRSGIQIAQFGLVSSCHLSNQVAEQLGGYARRLAPGHGHIE